MDTPEQQTAFKIWDFIDSINKSKVNLMEKNSHAIKAFDPFQVRRALALSMDCLVDAQEMNKVAHIAPDLQYLYLLHAIKPKFRRTTWPKKKTIPPEIHQIAEYFKENIDNTIAIVNRMNDKQYSDLLEKLNKGGRGETKRGKKK